MFAKYDLDGDRVLDEDEQRNMQADLEGQKVSITYYHSTEAFYSIHYNLLI